MVRGGELMLMSIGVKSPGLSDSRLPDGNHNSNISFHATPRAGTGGGREEGGRRE